MEPRAPWELNEREFSAVSALPVEKRYSHFVGRVADWQAAWALEGQDGVVMQGARQAEESVPLWPHPEYASVCATDEWAGTTPTRIEVHELATVWLPRMAQEGVLVTIFPTPADSGLVIRPLRLAGDLAEALGQIE